MNPQPCNHGDRVTHTRLTMTGEVTDIRRRGDAWMIRVTVQPECPPPGVWFYANLWEKA